MSVEKGEPKQRKADRTKAWQEAQRQSGEAKAKLQGKDVPAAAGPLVMTSGLAAKVREDLDAKLREYFLNATAPWTAMYQSPTYRSAIPERYDTTVPMTQETSTTPLVGYRTWSLSRAYPVGYRLVSAHAGGVWEPNRRREAVCEKGAETWASPFTAQDHARSACAVTPRLGCRCGIYAYRDKVDLSTDPDPVVVCGEVSLWGRVLVYSSGYRAQYAYPKRLVVVGGTKRTADLLELAYGVPCEVWD